MCLLLFLVISFFRPLFLVLTHTPISGVGSRQIRHFELSHIRYDLHHISIYILTFHVHLMIIVSKLARILRGRNGDQHLDIYHCTQHLTTLESKDLDRESQVGQWHRACIPRQPRRVSDGFQRGSRDMFLLIPEW